MIETVRQKAWAAKKTLVNSAKEFLPSWTRYARYRSIQFVPEAWPPRLSPAPAPSVHWPTPEQRPWFDLVPYFRSRPVVIPALLLHEIPGGILFPDSGTIADRDGCLIEESCKDRAVQAYTETFNRLRWRRPRSLGHELITSVMIGKLQSSYGHWLMDALPRLWALSLLDEQVTILVPSSLKGVRRKLLEMAAPKNALLRDVEPDVPVRSERVLLTPYTTYGGCGLIRAEIVEYLRTALVGAARAAAPPDYKAPTRIYVSRAKAGWSRVANEKELEARLTALGITPLIVEDLPIEEQLLTFAGATMVVGALSSGLANCLFQERGTLIEIFAGGIGTQSVTPSLNNAGIAMARGLTYRPVYNTNTTTEPSFPVDIDRVVAVVSAAPP